MELTLHTEGWFDAAHHLKDYDGPCSKLHGHTYKVEVWVKGNEEQLDKAGILWDFGKLKSITKIFDHNGEMNKHMRNNPTAEHTAMFFYLTLKADNNNLKYKVRVYEQIQPKESWCECGDFK